MNASVKKAAEEGAAEFEKRLLAKAGFQDGVFLIGMTKAQSNAVREMAKAAWSHGFQCGVLSAEKSIQQ